MKTTAKPMTKWLLSLVFALVVISLLILPQLLKVESHADYARTGISEGDTTIHISTGGQLAQLLVRTQKDKCTWKGKTIVLDNDINMRSVSTQPTLTVTSSSFGQCTSAGSFTRPAYDNSDNGNKGRIDDSWNYCVTFEGIFDGQGHTVTGLYTYKNSGGDGKWNGLLFDRLSGTVKNVCFRDCTIEYDHPKENSDSSLGLIGGVTSGGVVENVYVDSTVTYITHRTAGGNYLRTIGGIAGWVDGGTLRNCVAYPTVISANGQGSLNYPFNGTARITIGGVTGAIESTSTVVNCIGGGTYYANVTERSFCGVTESYSNPGWHLACPAKLGNDGDKTISNVYGGKQTTSPATGWKDYTRSTIGSYVPANFGSGTISVNNYSDSYAYWGTTVTVGSWTDFTTMISKVNNANNYGSEVIFKLTADIEAYPKASYAAWADFYSESTWASGASISVPGWPEQNNFVRFANFKGVLDGDGHVMSRLFSRRIAYNQTREGGLFQDFSGTMKNLAIIDSFFAGDHSKDGSGNTYTAASGVQYGGLAGKGSGTIENCYFDYDCFMINNYACNSSNGYCGYGYLFGGLSGTLNLKNVQCAGRFWVCNTSMQNTIQTTGGSACGVIAGNGGYTVNIENFVFSGPRSTYIGGSGGTNDVAYLVHWSNTSCNFSGNNFYGKSNGSAGNTTGVGPTADGTNYKLIPRFGEVGPAALATTFGSGTYKLSTFAQQGSTSGKFRLLAKISRSAAKSATQVGFYLTNSEGKHATVPVTGVYKSVTASGSTLSAGSLAGRGDYLIAIAVTGATKGQSLTIQPYIKIGSAYCYGESTAWTIE